MKTRLRFFALILTIILLIVFMSACGKNKNNQSGTSASTETSEPAQQSSAPGPDANEAVSYENGNRFDYTNTILQPFDYNGVKISDDSAFRREFNYAMEYLLSVPTDDYLKVMRVREGKDVEGSEYLGGWYDGGLWVGATFGQYVSALARGYAVTGDERLKQKATELIDGWADCISEDGFFYFSPDRTSNSTHYTYDKVVLMCVDVYTYIGGEVGDRALQYLETATDFALTYLNRTRRNATPNGPHSGQSVSDGVSDIEWYILSENLYRAYLATGNELYKDFGDVWNYDYFWNALLEGYGAQYYNVHAYSHTNSISGAALKYMLTGNVYYLNVLRNAYEMYDAYETYPNGMYGTGERLVGTVKNLNDAINSNINNCEVPCNSWAGLKITKYLTELTGASKYLDWSEKLMYNGTLGALRITEDYVRRGITFYYANYQKQASKEYYGGSWPCCSGTYFLNLCDVFDRLYFKSEDALYVANYVSSEVENNYGGRNVILTQETDFPEDSKAEFTVRCTSKVDFALKLRIPEWATGYSVTLNGKTVNAAVDADGWLTVGESFCNGDKIVLDIVSPIPCHAEQSAAVLNAGKHCACAVPMATSLEDVKNIVEAVEKSGKNYMMMETSLYTYQFFYVKNMIESGQTGKIQFLRGSHYQDMAGWSDYWMGLPPMWYGTHAIAPMVLLSGSRIKRVNCFGSGTMSECLRRQYGNPYPVETALFEFENGLKAEATRSLFETARAYKEGLSVYGSKASFEWGFSDGDDPYVTVALPLEKGQRGSGFEVKQVKMPNYHASLPFQIQRFTVGDKFDPIDPQRSLSVGSGGPHHGSHPHLVNEFIMSIVENRKPWIDETISANITSAGICAHISAMKNGESVIVPAFD